MKVLQVVPTFHPYTASGPSRVAYMISKHLARRGHSVTVYTSNITDQFNSLKSGIEKYDGIEVHRFPSIGALFTRVIKFIATPILIPQIKKEIKEFDIIHIHEFTTFQGIICHHYAKKNTAPYILQVHGSLPKIGKWKTLKKIHLILFGRKLLNNSSKVVALSPTEAEHYRRMNVEEEKITIIPNGIDLSEFSTLPPKGLFRKKFNIPRNRKIILYLGRIHKTKGIHLLVKAYHYLIKHMKCADTILVIAGPDDGYYRKIRTLVHSLKISTNVLFTGFLTESDKLKAFVDADVFVTPIFYGFPLTFLEACATGKPIVTTDFGDKLEWINNKVGYVVPPASRKLALAIHKLIQDEDLNKKFGENSKKIVKSNFTIEKVVSRLEKTYEEIIRK